MGGPRGASAFNVECLKTLHPRGLEARIWDTLDAEGTMPSTSNRAPWIAAAITGGLLLGAFWMGSEDAAEGTSSFASSFSCSSGS